MREIDYFLSFYCPKPKLYLAYDRTAWYGRQDAEFRMTFDSNIRSRRERLSLELGDEAEPLYDYSYQLLEIKAAGAYPLWLTGALTELGIYPVSFSKYGSIYQKEQEARAVFREAAAALENGMECSASDRFELCDWENTACMVINEADYAGRKLENNKGKGEQKQCLPV